MGVVHNFLVPVSSFKGSGFLRYEEWCVRCPELLVLL